jgi:hypothetical protein
MTTMSISYSDALATIALLVSIGCAYYAKIQSKYARLAFSDTRRAHLSNNHKSYYQKLVGAQNQLKPDLRLLSEKASAVLTSIVDLCDSHDKSPKSGRYLRHLVHEAAEMIFTAFNGQLGWQSGRNITYRFYQFKHCEQDLNPCQHYSGNEEFRRTLHAAFRGNPNAFQEAELLKDAYFCELVEQARSRLDEKKAHKLLLLIQEMLNDFIKYYDDLRPQLIEKSDYLEGLLKEGEMEHFKLSESYTIHRALSYRKVTLNSLYYLHFPRISQDIARHISTPTSYVIYTCALLHAIQSFHSWGWEYDH